MTLKNTTKKWLKLEVMFHCQKIIVALSETDRLMKEIQKIELGI